MTAEQLITVHADEGQLVSVVGDTYRLVITGEQTGGAFAIIDMMVPPGAGPGPHSHAGFQESFHVLEGEVEIKTENGSLIAKKGDFVNIPLGGMIHCFKNKSDKPARLWCTVVPAGLEKFFLEFDEKKPKGEEIKALAAKYGQQLYPPDYLD